MIKWIKVKGNDLFVDGEKLNTTIGRFLNNLSKTNSVDIPSLRKATSDLLNIKRSIPIFINSDLLLVKVKLNKEETIYFNYVAVKDYLIKEKMIFLFFNDGTKQKLLISKRRSQNLMFNATKVYDYWA